MLILRLLKLEFLLFILLVTNISIKSCCCECCKAGNQKTTKRYSIPEILARENNNFVEKKVANGLKVSEETSQNYYLDSGIDIDVPLNIMWGNNNCAVLCVYRYFLSNKFFYDRITSKTETKPEKILYVTESEKNRRLKKFRKEIGKFNVFLDKNSDILKEALTKKRDYNKEIKQAMEQVSHQIGCCYDALEFLECFFWHYCLEDFQFIRSDFSNSEIRYYINDSNYEQIENGFLLQDDTIKIVGKYIFFYNTLDRKIKIKNQLKIKLSDSSVKKYEINGIFGFAGNYYKNKKGDLISNEADCDYCLIVPVYDKNKNKVGYIKYQFDERSEIRDLDYFYNLENFRGFKNPFFIEFIYREKE